MTGKNNHLDINISFETLFRILFVGLGAVLLYLIRDVVVVLILSVIIASAVSPLATYLQKRGLPRALAVFLIYLFALLILALVLYLIISPLSSEVDNLGLVVPIYFDKIQSSFKEIRDTSPQYEQLLNQVQARLDNIGLALARLSGNIFGAATKLFGGVVSAVFVIVISFYLSAQEHGISAFLRSVTPREHQAYILNLWSRSQHKLGRWLQVQLLASAIVGVLVFIGLSIFGIRHRVLLALLAALLEVIPFVGPLLAAVPAVLLGFLKSPIVALWTLVVYAVVQQIENHVIVPNIMRRVVGLNPVVVIIALLIGGELAGVPGIILAVPVAVVAVELLKDLDHHHNSAGSSE